MEVDDVEMHSDDEFEQTLELLDEEAITAASVKVVQIVTDCSSRKNILDLKLLLTLCLLSTLYIKWTCLSSCQGSIIDCIFWEMIKNKMVEKQAV